MRPVSPLPLGCPLQPLREEDSIRQAGESIVCGRVVELFLRGLALCDILMCDNDSGWTRSPKGRGTQAEPAARVRGGARAFEIVFAMLSGEDGSNARDDLCCLERASARP